MNKEKLNVLLTKILAFAPSADSLSRWHLELTSLSDEEGTAAFNALMREAIIGNLEPITVIEKVNDLRAVMILETGGEHPWISTAPRFHGDGSPYNPTPEFLTWHRRESKRRYKSADQNGDIFLIQNPAAWSWTTDAKGSVLLVRPAPKPTGEQLQKKKVSGPKWSY